MAAKQADAGQRRAASEPATMPAPRAHLHGIFTLNRLPFWLLMIVILLGAGLTALILNLIFPWDSSIADLPFAIQSPLRANYSADPRAASIAQVDLKLLSQVLADEPDISSAFRVETIVHGLNTLVPSVTPLFTQVFQFTPTPTISLTVATTHTLAPSATPTVTTSPTHTRLPTKPLPTRVPPTAAPSATPQPADTSAPPPTETLPPTQPPPPTATNPPPPDTATPPPAATAAPPTTQPGYPPPPPAYPAPDD